MSNDIIISCIYAYTVVRIYSGLIIKHCGTLISQLTFGRQNIERQAFGAYIKFIYNDITNKLSVVIHLKLLLDK